MGPPAASLPASALPGIAPKAAMLLPSHHGPLRPHHVALLLPIDQVSTAGWPCQQAKAAACGMGPQPIRDGWREGGHEGGPIEGPEATLLVVLG
jgi:hypothetical protein